MEEAHSIMQKTQADEVEWRRLQEKLSTELESLQGQVEHLSHARDELTESNLLTRGRIESKRQQMADISLIEEEMFPFLMQLTERLQTLPDRDIPFLQTERRERIAKLSEVLRDPTVSISEKYRKSMEALQIEAEFGLTVETYQDMIKLNDQIVLVNILRLGRLGLYYVNLDESDCGFYNIADDDWQLLPKQYIHQLQTAVDIADKRRPAELLNMPLGQMVEK